MGKGKLLAPALISGMVGGLLLSVGSVQAGMAQKAKQKVAKAQDLFTEVQKETDSWGLWKNTRKILQNARKNLRREDYESAIARAEKALFQAQTSLRQFREEQAEWNKAFRTAQKREAFPETAWVSGRS